MIKCGCGSPLNANGDCIRELKEISDKKDNKEKAQVWLKNMAIHAATNFEKSGLM